MEFRRQSAEKRAAMRLNSITSNMPVWNVGPTVFGGRVVDLAVNPENSNEFLAAFASGGLWYTRNNGLSFEALFEQEEVMTIGDIAVDWSRRYIVVGSGENNSSRSSYSGCGLFGSRDWGKSWEKLGLEESHHIGRILMHPSDSNTIYVASLGHLYSANPERGIYRTKNGGKSWKKILYIDENTGGIDLIIDPHSPDRIWAATWERWRRAWHFEGYGPGTGIYRSTNGGDNWERMTGRNSGFPYNDSLGRIGLDIYSDGKEVRLYAVLDNQAKLKKDDKEKEEGLSIDGFITMSKVTFLDLDTADLSHFLKKHRFPKKYTVEKVRKLVASDSLTPAALADYLEDGNSRLFRTQVIGAELYVSDDLGKSWTKTHADPLKGLVFSYGYYFGQVRVAPSDKNQVYIMGVPMLFSENGGKDFRLIHQPNVHVDHHALWINPNDPGHFINGNDGGIVISYDTGRHFMRVHHPPVGQFYTVNYDMDEPFNIYGGTQDNGVWKGPSNYQSNDAWHQEGHYPYKKILGGDGMQIAVDDEDGMVYTGFQFGHYFNLNENGKSRKITPKHELGEEHYRWNWQSPILLSYHHKDIVYFGAQKLLRSMDQGKHFTAISPDLTNGMKKGNVPFGTITCLSESPSQFGLIYTGSDDGQVHRTDDGGVRWHELGETLPKHLWVSRIVASQHKTDRVYLCLNGYRWDNMETHIYVSEDRGENWISVKANLPDEPVNVLVEDPVNPDLLFVGTDHGVYYSLDGGKKYMHLSRHLPAVPVHDLRVHKRDAKLIIGTHGRSIFVCDIRPLQSFVSNVKEKLAVYEKRLEKNYQKSWGINTDVWKTLEKDHRISMTVWSPKDQEVVFDLRYDGLLLKSQKKMLRMGLNYVDVDVFVDDNRIKKYEKKYGSERVKKYGLKKRDNGLYIPGPGDYTLILKTDKNQLDINLKIKNSH